MDQMRASVLLIVIALAAVGGCDSGSSNDRAATVPTQPSSVDASPEPVPLTKKSAREALLTVDDMPTGWATTKAEPDASKVTISPTRCAVLVGATKGRTTLAKTVFTQGGLLGSRLTEEIYRPTGSTPKQRLDAIKKSLGSCSTYRAKDASGSSTVMLNALSFPKLGDATVAVRGEIETPVIKASDDVVYVAVGQQIVRFDSVVVSSSISGEQLEKLVRAGVKRVQACA